MKNFLPILAVVLLVAACKHEPEAKIKHGDQLVFTTEDTVLRDGDLVGVSMDSPLSYTNVKMTYASGALTPVNNLYWPVDMPDSAVTFLAYYPYSAEYNNGGTVVFSAAPDQTTDEAFRASALMVSITKASHTQPAVDFTFSQRMSKLVFYLRNDSGSPVKDVFFTAYPTVQFNMDKNEIRVNGEKVDIHAHLTATSSEGVAAYEAIIAPQNLTLSITLRTDAGDYTAVMNSKTTFGSGKQYSNARLVVLEAGKTGRTINFATNEAKWAATPDFVYQEPLSGGAEFENITDPGLYKITNGVATPIRIFASGCDQYSLINISTDSVYGWRLMDPVLGEMFEILTGAVYTKEGASISAEVRSHGLEWTEADFTSKATVVKVADGLAWLLDENKEYGYIIMSE